MLVEGEVDTSDWFSSVLNEKVLDSNGEDNDEDEKIIVEESREDVVLVGSKFTRIDLVEDLHEDKGIEDDGEVNSLLVVLEHEISELLSSHAFGYRVSGLESIDIIGESEHLLAEEDQANENSGLVDALSKNVTPHD